jgi:hypothetical protein
MFLHKLHSHSSEFHFAVWRYETGHGDTVFQMLKYSLQKSNEHKKQTNSMVFSPQANHTNNTQKDMLCPLVSLYECNLVHIILITYCRNIPFIFLIYFCRRSQILLSDLQPMKLQRFSKLQTSSFQMKVCQSLKYWTVFPLYWLTLCTVKFVLY